MSTTTTLERALCAVCGAERTVKFGGPRNFFPRGWNCETQSAELKCGTCGGIRAHAVARERVGTYFENRYAAIKAIGEAEAVGITVQRFRFEIDYDGEVKQRLDTGTWTISIDERLNPVQVSEVIQQARAYIDCSTATRWWVQAETPRRYPLRWLPFRLNGSTRAWRLSDSTVVL